jgi:ABC-type antimicrobial peptide transport system permease subunit
MICIVLYIGVIERTKEIGILRAVGYKARNIRFLFITEAVIIITIANVVAIVISLLIEVLLNPKVEELSTFKNAFSISFMTILGVYILTLVIAVLAGIYPANKAARVDPEKSLRME